ncbi:FixH family protein [Tenacibaculum xiamenense]|uniref:FixH family protein n=1 Tax=Tenacibaculum xiamenense TaxID=1261553 RepID=UPI0038955422
MKLNWGTGIVIAIIGFVAFILYFVITMSTDKKFNHDLVTEKYYQKELEYQDNIEASRNAKSLENNIKITQSKEGLTVNFPEDFEYHKITGKVFLYRPSNKQLDFELPLSLSNTYLLVPEKRLLGGRWNITVKWSYEGKDYLYKEELTY